MAVTSQNYPTCASVGGFFELALCKNDGVSSSVGMMTFPTYGKKRTVPNHQPGIYNYIYMWENHQTKFKNAPAASMLDHHRRFILIDAIQMRNDPTTMPDLPLR